MKSFEESQKSKKTVSSMIENKKEPEKKGKKNKKVEKGKKTRKKQIFLVHYCRKYLTYNKCFIEDKPSPKPSPRPREVAPPSPPQGAGDELDQETIERNRQNLRNRMMKKGPSKKDKT